MTPGEHAKISKAVAELLSRESNTDLTAEELSEEITSTVVEIYEEIQAKAYNLIVLGHFRLSETESYVAAVGPLSTRATARAREVGERFAWDYKTRRGTGKFTLVPLVRNPAEAWDAARTAQLLEYEGHMGSVTPGIEPTYEPMRFDLPDDVRLRIATEVEPQPYYATGGEPYEKGLTCACGIESVRGGAHVCPRHPEGREGDS